MRLKSVAVLRAPDPLGYSTAKKVNTAVRSPGRCTSFGLFLTNIVPFLPFCSRLIQAESIHLDQKPRVNTDLIQVIQVIQAKFNIIHMRARAYASIFFLHIIHFLRLKFEFVRNSLDHLDQTNARAGFRLDHPLGFAWITWIRPMPERVSAFLCFVGGGRRSKTRPKWSDRCGDPAAGSRQSGGN